MAAVDSVRLAIGVLLFVAAALTLDGFRRSITRQDAGCEGSVPSWRAAAALGGILALALALVSPLAPLSVSLLSADALQHSLLTLVAAPLLLLSWSAATVARLARAGGALARPYPALALFIGVSWVAALPIVAGLAAALPAVHTLLQLLLFGAALQLWRHALPGVQGRPPPRSGFAVSYLFVAVMGTAKLVGGILLFGSRSLYPTYALTSLGWFNNAVDDQQIAGGLYVVLGASVFTGLILVSLAASLRHEDRLQQEREAIEDGSLGMARWT